MKNDQVWNGIQETMNALLLSGSNPGNYLDYSYAQDYEIYKKQELKSIKTCSFENVQEQSSNFSIFHQTSWSYGVVMRSSPSQISKCKFFFLYEPVKVTQTHKKTMCDTLTHQGQAICLRCSKQVPCLKALQKGSFPQNATVLCPL